MNERWPPVVSCVSHRGFGAWLGCLCLTGAQIVPAVLPNVQASLDVQFVAAGETFSVAVIGWVGGGGGGGEQVSVSLARCGHVRCLLVLCAMHTKHMWTNAAPVCRSVCSLLLRPVSMNKCQH